MATDSLHDPFSARDVHKDGRTHSRLTGRRLLFIAVLLHVALHVVVSLMRKDIDFDDAVSYLAASGHQSAYAWLIQTGSPPYGVWAPAGEWHRMLTPAKPFAFYTIARGLGTYDLHPPLYFWLVHLGLVGAGFHTWIGSVLNLGFDLLSIAALFLFARRVLGDAREAALAALFWALSPGPLQAAIEARQYSLLGLISIVFVHQVFCAQDRGRPFGFHTALWLCLSTWLGLMTHYQFVIVVALGGACLALRLWRHDRLRFVIAMAALMAGIALMLPLSDLVLASVARQRLQHMAFDWKQFGVRFTSVLAAPSTFFVVGLPQQIAWVTGALGGASFFWISLRRRGVRLQTALATLDQPTQNLLIMLGGVLGALSVVYLGFRTPSWAMQPKYLSWAHPLIACLLVRSLRGLSGSFRRLLPLFCGLLLLGNASFVCARGLHSALSIRAARAELVGVDRVVLDTASRGVVLSALVHIPGDVPVFVGGQKWLIEHPEAWLHAMTARSIWISEPSRGNSRQGSLQLEALLRERLRPSARHSPLWPQQVVYRLSASEAPVPAPHATQE